MNCTVCDKGNMKLLKTCDNNFCKRKGGLLPIYETQCPDCHVTLVLKCTDTTCGKYGMA